MAFILKDHLLTIYDEILKNIQTLIFLQYLLYFIFFGFILIFANLDLLRDAIFLDLKYFFFLGLLPV